MKTVLLSTLFLIGTAPIFNSNAQVFNGYALYTEMGSTSTYLIDRDGNIAHSWQSSLMSNYSVKLKDNGNIVRGVVDWGAPLMGAAGGGIVQELNPSGGVVWSFTYSNWQHLSHHDLEILPNGNVLLIAWEVKSPSAVLQAGYAGSQELWPTHIIEVQQNGTGGQIVWEWHMWDHLIQDYNSAKDNYGVVEDHPELMDINAVQPFGFDGDWFHVNGLDYNAELDQIVFSSRSASEFFIIDHSTTTAEAAGHTGGNSGKGGDFLYRWGNPSNYGSSVAGTIPAAVHDPHWITDDGRPNSGYIQFFNNEAGQNGSSVVDAINPPTAGWLYNYSGTSYGPAVQDYRHECLASSWGQSASDMMSNGNLFVAVSGEYMYEVNSGGTVVWQYNAAPAKAFRYECDHPGIIALLGENPCGLDVNNLQDLEIVSFYPNPSENGLFYLDGIEVSQNDVHVSVLNMLGEVVFESENSEIIDLSGEANGVYLATVSITGGSSVSRKISLMK